MVVAVVPLVAPAALLVVLPVAVVVVAVVQLVASAALLVVPAVVSGVLPALV